MHEAALVANLLDAMESEAGAAGITRITGALLRVGGLRNAVPELLVSAFEVLSRGTMAEGATLRVESVPVVLECADCGLENRAEEWIFLCAGCGSSRTKVISGQEMDLIEITGTDGGTP